MQHVAISAGQVSHLVDAHGIVASAQLPVRGRLLDAEDRLAEGRA